MATYGIRGKDCILPANKATAMEWAALPTNERLRVEIKRDRNSKHNAMYWSLLQYVADALNHGPGGNATKESVHKWLKLRMGYFKTVELSSADADVAGTPMAIEYESIAFDEMDQTQFSQFFDTALDLIQTQICPYLMDSPHAAQVQQIMREAQRGAA